MIFYSVTMRYSQLRNADHNACLLCYRNLMTIIMEKGHSRVPVYYEQPTNIIGLVLVLVPALQFSNTLIIIYSRRRRFSLIFSRDFSRELGLVLYEL